ncbi:MAG TPA: short-chain dehydrogenase/reductase [Verrucomicrobiae bacterium]|nr:short-chain dehydrogenase/reductase [Verrucomicrobiae bacterium]
MDLHLAGKLALVTGASKGIGRATAAILAKEGCDLALVSRDPATLNAAADAIRRESSVSVRTLPADLSKQDAVERVAAEFPELDILVNNAGAIPPGNLLVIGNDAWRSAWDLKVFGYISMCRALYPSLKKRAGVIVNIIGAAGERLDPNYIAGSMGNASLMAFTKALAKGAVKDGMRVVAVNPGPVSTDRLEVMMRGRAKAQLGDESRWRELLSGMSFGRAATPEEIGNAVAFLASPLSAYTTGTILTIDGVTG